MSDSKKVTWNDLHEAKPSELMKTYKLDHKALERQIRHHWDGANAQERRQLYEKVYSNKR